ncbi:unnamed protein product [Meloidogyne enterolobii]|uniref:Uncharacterized protein n=1 Tax=Meloidogyne enterolobii TaxID=390850 RepID=A0ACB0XKE3_MELEN
MVPSTSYDEAEISPQHNSTASQSDNESSNSANHGSSPEETFNDENALPAALERLHIESKEKRNKEKRKYMDEDYLKEQSSRKLCKSSSKLFNSTDCISSSSSNYLEKFF